MHLYVTKYIFKKLLLFGLDLKNIHEYLEKKKNIQKSLIDYIDCIDDTEEYYSNLLSIFHDQKISEDPRELKALLVLIMQIVNYHDRTPQFFSKIEQILLFFKDEILKFFSNDELFELFHNNKRILLFLLKEEIVKIDLQVLGELEDFNLRSLNYGSYFEPEIYAFIDSQLPPETEDKKEDENVVSDAFEEKRMIGENDDPLAHLIRHDLIDEFISYVNQNNVFLASKIKHSIFETNLFLAVRNQTLIEYSAFFGSIQVFKYLFKNGIKLTTDLWLYAIHGQNPEMFKILEENQIKPTKICLAESIKCHHIEITNYIINNFIDNDNENNRAFLDNNAIQYCNYLFFPDESNLTKYFYNFCEYDYISIVEFLLKDKNVDINIEGNILELFIF